MQNIVWGFKYFDNTFSVLYVQQQKITDQNHIIIDILHLKIYIYHSIKTIHNTLLQIQDINDKKTSEICIMKEK